MRIDATGTAESATVDFDHHDTTRSAAEFRAQYEDLRATCPVAHVDRYGGFVLVSGYDGIKQVTSARDDYSSGQDGIWIPASGLPPVPALEFDGDDHRAWRRVLDRLLSPTVTRDLEPVVLDIADTLIDEIAGRGHADLVSAYTHPLPGVVIGRLLGLTFEESLRSQQLADAMFRSVGTDAFGQNYGAFAQFALERLHSRRQSPQGDVLSDLASGHYEGMDIDDDVAMQIFVALLGGGHHSTASGLAGLVHHVLADDLVRRRIAEDDDAAVQAVNESLRLTTPLQLFARTATVDTEIGGCPIGQGTRVLLNFAAANRDPDEFEQPHSFRLDRAYNRHLAFGRGVHNCVGQHLARLELRAGLTRLLERLPDIALDGEVAFSTLVAGQLMTISSMPVRFAPK